MHSTKNRPASQHPRAFRTNLAVAIGILLLAGSFSATKAEDVESFLAYGASAESQQVVAVRIRVASDAVSLQPTDIRHTLGFEAAPLLFDAKNRLLHVASLRGGEKKENVLAVFSVASDGQLALKKRFPLKHGSAYLSHDRSGRFLLSVSYFEGHVDIYRLDDAGLPDRLVQTIHEGRDKAHAILISPSNRFAYVPYVKDQNALFQYAFDSGSGQLSALTPPRAVAPEGVGPRHVAYHPKKPFVFFSNEQHLGATSYRIDEQGSLTLVDVEDAGGLKAAQGLAASDIAITPDGRFLYVGMRDFANNALDAIHRYRVQSDGSLTHLGKTPADAIPWGLQIASQGKLLLVTAAQGNTLTAFAIGPEGGLEKRGSLEWGKMIRDIAIVK